jgi:hypothetical protein
VSLQRSHLDIHSLFSRISRIDHSSSGSIAPQSVKLAETQSFAISDMQAKQDSNSKPGGERFESFPSYLAIERHQKGAFFCWVAELAWNL